MSLISGSRDILYTLGAGFKRIALGRGECALGSQVQAWP